MDVQSAVWKQLATLERRLHQVAQEVGIMKEAESERQAHFLRQYAANCVADLAAALQRGDLAAGGDLASGPQHHDPAPMQPAEQ